MKHGIIIGIQTQKQRDIHAKNFTHPYTPFSLTTICYIDTMCYAVDLYHF